MSPSARSRAWTLLPLVLAAFYVACDSRACLAQSDLFAGFRDELIDECCLCLARRGTAAPGASCGVAQIAADGGVVIADGGTALPDDPDFPGDNGDDVLDDFELPCLCGEDATTCAQTLKRGETVVVTGACVSQGADPFRPAPCEDECRGVLTFDPPVVAP